jgi:hypothetical protein
MSSSLKNRIRALEEQVAPPSLTAMGEWELICFMADQIQAGVKGIESAIKECYPELLERVLERCLL